MSRVDVELSDVLDAVVARLQQQLGLNDSTCFFSVDPDSPPPSAADIYLVVTPDGGTFDQEAFDGGGEEQLTCNTGVTVTIQSAIKLDPGGKDRERLLNTSRGMVKMLTRVLRALSGQDLEVGGRKFLRELIRPEGFSRPNRQGQRSGNARDSIGSLAVSFALSFDWDVSEAPE